VDKSISIPDASQRTAIVGRTGSGKTQFGVYFLGTQINGPWKELPVTIIDFKHAQLIGELQATVIKVTDKPPTKPGLYVIRPFPGDDDKALIQYLLRVWAQQNHGIYCDECLDLGPRNRGFRRILSQGREKNIPMIYCTQRPSWVDMYSFSEATYICAFQLTLPKDEARVNEFAPGYVNIRLEPFQSYWYDVPDNKGQVLTPCPAQADILARYYPEYVDEVIYTPSVEAQARGERPKVLL
jgi:hypothetical protein